MGLMDKVKKILFDEDEIEVPVKSDELPKREVKKESFPSRGSFINHHEEVEEENPIKEVIVPKEKEEVHEEVEIKKNFNFADDDDFDYLPKRANEKSEVHEEVKSRIDMYNVYDEYKRKESTPTKTFHAGLQENKDYKKIIKDEEPSKEKRPFKVTPVISPVYGIIDETKVEKTIEKKVEVSPVRNFGPVSYTDEKVPKFEEKEKVVIPEKIEITDDEIQTSGIENDYLDNNNIEESFESTSEYEKINREDALEHDDFQYTPQKNEISEEEKHENEKLEDTIETDLFNLIDSMYKDDEESGDED